MNGFRLIEHTADVGLEAWGGTLAEAFANAAFGMFSIIAELDAVREAEERRVELEEDDLEGLLFEWLNRLLYYLDVDGLLFRKFDVALDGCRLAATCRGERYDPARHVLKTGVKSATYYMMEVNAQDNRVRVILDI